MKLLNELLAIHHRHPSWAPEELATERYAEKIDERWRLTDRGRREMQPEIDRFAAVLYPDDLPSV